MIYNWNEFLNRWNAELLESEDFKDSGLPPDVAVSRWFGYPGATEQEIARAEARLGTQFPPSYREFLQFSNGWRQTSPFIDQLWSTEQVDWFRVRNQDWIDILLSFEYPKVPDAEYLVYGSNIEQPQRNEYLRTVLEVSDIGDAAVYLLNPQITTPSGEWEAWFLASWQPSISRYRSFWDMMQAEYQTFRELNAHDIKRFRVNGDTNLLFTKLPGLVDELLQQAQKYKQYLPTRSSLIALYDTGIIDALEQTAARIQLLVTQHTDATLLLTALRQLAKEAQQEQRDIQTKPRQEITHINFWDLDFSKAAEFASEFGRAEGLRQAAGRIDWFINES